MKQKKTHRQIKGVVAWGGEGEWNGSLGIAGINNYVYCRWINNKVLHIAQGTTFNILGKTIMEKNEKKSAYI